MSVLDRINYELDESYLVEHVTKKHDEARNQYRLKSIEVPDDTAFDNQIADYYNYHFTKCISSGGEFPRSEAAGRAKKLINEYCRRTRKNRLDIYSDGRSGANGGMMKVLDIIMDGLKEESIENHYRDVIDRYVAPSIWDEQLHIIKEFLKRIPDTSAYDLEHPEKYVDNYEELIRLRVDQLRSVSKIFKRRQ